MKLLEYGGKGEVYKAYKMAPHRIAQDVQAIKNWLLKQPHLPLIRGGKYHALLLYFLFISLLLYYLFIVFI
jgi:hypothetical protein